MKRILIGLGVGAVIVGSLFSLTAFAATPDIYGACSSGADNAICKGKGETVDGTLKTIVDVLLMVVGILAVIMLIWGGIQYMTSSGDSAKVTKAKGTILYSVIGLVVAVFAFGVVQLVVNVMGGAVSSGGSSTTSETEGADSDSDSSADSGNE